MDAQATTVSQSHSKAGFGVAVFAALIGLAIVSITGHVQASTLHDAAHDVRHATGFPCH